MSAGIILLAALFLAVPISVKYVTSFQIRALVDALRRREREIDAMYARLDAIDVEREVVERATGQVLEQRRWSATRRSLMEDELQRVRRRSARARFEPQAPPVWAAGATDDGGRGPADTVWAGSTAAAEAAA